MLTQKNTNFKKRIIFLVGSSSILKSRKISKYIFLNLSDSQIVGLSFPAKIKLIGTTNNVLLQVVLSYP